MLSQREDAELRQFFAIRADLNAAARGGTAEDVGHHLDELEIMQKHTESDSIRHACRMALNAYAPRPAAIIA